MRLLLIRHAESLNQVYERGDDYAAQRSPDPPLSELGQAQAAALADWARQGAVFGEITHLFSSPMRRAVQTAAPLAETLGLAVHLSLLAYEWGGVNAGPLGDFAPVAGGDFATLQRECPRLLWPAELTGRAWDGGYEAWEDANFTRRARAVLAELRVVETAGVVALVTHADFARSLLLTLGRPPVGLQNAEALFLPCSLGPHNPLM
ncbi:histidine phosphatase family protein [Deinococcus lacus]|uniref:Histidine phosphatase family protein n=1 Tax=Deinococcus lacus TaxID=392561 RepID=A0ABW1Y9U9_9DEIO